MASGGKEVEIKLPVDQDSFLGVKDKIKDIAEFKKTVKQKDEYLTPSHRNFLDVKFPFEWLSIRERGDKAILNYKHFHPENVETFTHCDEFETEIQDLDKLKGMFSALNFQSLVVVDKERDVYVYKDEFEVALDSVKDLGFFVEIEALKDFGSVEETREKLFEFAKSLSLNIDNPDKRGYPYLLMEKNGLIK